MKLMLKRDFVHIVCMAWWWSIIICGLNSKYVGSFKWFIWNSSCSILDVETDYSYVYYVAIFANITSMHVERLHNITILLFCSIWFRLALYKIGWCFRLCLCEHRYFFTDCNCIYAYYLTYHRPYTRIIHIKSPTFIGFRLYCMTNQQSRHSFKPAALQNFVCGGVHMWCAIITDFQLYFAAGRNFPRLSSKILKGNVPSTLIRSSGVWEV